MINNTNENIIGRLKKLSDPKATLDIFIAYTSIVGIYEILTELSDNFKQINIYIGKDTLASHKIIDTNQKIDFDKAYENAPINSNEININGNINNIEYEMTIDNFLSTKKFNIYKLRHLSDRLSNEYQRYNMFHGKVYSISYEDGGFVQIVGSHNLTKNALENKIEGIDYKANEISIEVKDIELQSFLENIKDDKSFNDKHYSLYTINKISELIDENLFDGDYFHNLIKSTASEKIAQNSESIDFESIKNKIPFYKNLREHQKEAVEFLYNKITLSGGSFLCLPTGMGKTFVSLTLIYIMAGVIKPTKRCLILVPNEKIEKQWKRDWKKLHSIGDDNTERMIRKNMSESDLIFKSYNGKAFENSSSKNSLIEKENLMHEIERADLIIVEESHNFRNQSTHITRKSRQQILRTMISDAFNGSVESQPAILLVTATPINNDISDLISQVQLFPSVYKGEIYQYKNEVINSMKELMEIFTSNKRNYEKEKSNNENFGYEDSQYLINEKWDKIVNKDFAGNQSYNSYIDFLNNFIYKGSKNHIIDENFNPENDTNDFNIENHVIERPYKIDDNISLKIEDCIKDLRELTKGKKYGIFGSMLSADKLFIMNLYKTLESSPIATIGIMERFIEKWMGASKDPELMEKYVQDQIKAEQRSMNGLNQNEDEPEIEIGEFYDNRKFSEKLSEKKSWVKDIFTKDEVQFLYKKIIEILKDLVINYNEVNVIDIEYFIKNKKFEKEKHLYYDLKSQIKSMNGSSKLYKTLIFAHYKDTANYIFELVSRFDFVIKYASDNDIDVDDVVFEANQSPNKVDGFAPLSRTVGKVEEYKNLMKFGNAKDFEEFESQNMKASIMVATDTWAEGHNLQDATMVISYDTHWNPMRVVQRVGRIVRILNDELVHHIYERLKAKKKVRYYWLKADEDLIKHVDLNKIISFKMMQIISSGFKYPISFNEFMNNDDIRVKKIRSMINEQTRGGNSETLINERNEIKSMFYGINSDVYDSRLDSFNFEMNTSIRNEDKMNYYYNGTVAVSNDNLNNNDNLIIYFFLSYGNSKMIVPIKKNGNEYSNLDISSNDTNDFANGNVAAVIYEETKGAKVVNNNKINFIVNDEEKIKDKIIDSIENFEKDLNYFDDQIKYYGIYIKENNEN